jgi:uncharacterized protein YkvS
VVVRQLLASGSTLVWGMAGVGKVREFVLGLVGLVLDVLSNWACVEISS